MEAKTVLITGGSRGIGAAIASEFRQHGYRVLTPTHREMDLSDSASIEAYCKGLDCSIDTIVNNAGINTIARTEELTEGIFEQMLQINLKAPVQLIRLLREKVGNSGAGHIVNLSSVWSTVSKEGRLGYTATKSAINGITRTLALEFAKDNILVNSVAPGFVDTELTRTNNTPEQIAGLTDVIPIGRLAQPAEIAGLVYFLGSEMNTYITGQTILIDGGYTCR